MAAKPRACIDEHRFHRAGDLIAALRPEDPKWGPDPSKWMFRGHADATWKLLPSANRRKDLLRFMASARNAPGLAGDDRYCAPTFGALTKLLRDFADMLNSAGREVPVAAEPSEDWLDHVFKKNPPFEPMFRRLWALGQHHALPTMLLDWTRVGTYAAYFAASDVAALNDPEEGDLVVWALNEVVDNRSGLIDGSRSELHVLRPPLAGNPNLHSQGGVFTFSTWPYKEVPTSPVWASIVDHVVDAIATDEYIDRFPDRFPPLPGTLMRRLSLPRREATEVLKLLGYERVAGMTLFPGLDGVVRSVRDRRHER